MAKNSIHFESLNFSILFFSKLLKENNCEHFLFFGSLLGLIRDNSAIVGDDDVDFYVNQNHYEDVVAFLKKIRFKIRYKKPPNNTKYFIQAEGKIENHPIRVEFYFYDTTTDDNYILEYWNFLGQTDNMQKVLKVPKTLIFPIKEIPFINTLICVPKLPEKICEFLYGNNWKVPIKKDTDYRIDVLNGNPIQIPIKN
jgi:phosphorylcholine metabolism protein LicD